MIIASDTVQQGCNLWCDYVHTQFDPAHLLSELGFTIIFDVLLVFFIWGKLLKPYLDRRVNQAHADLDAEHHVDHHEHSEDEVPPARDLRIR